MPSDGPAFCENCGVPLPEGITHDGMEQCIAELRKALARQTRAAEGLAFEVSTRIYGILENLAHDPSLGGVPFSVREPSTGKVLVLHNQTVSGIMTAIFREYEKAGDWSPLADKKKELAQTHDGARRLFGLLQSVVELADDKMVWPKSLRKAIDEGLAEAKQHGLHLRGRRS